MMEEKLRSAAQIYNEIPIPEELAPMVKDTISNHSRVHHAQRHWLRYAAAAAVLCLGLFVGGINVSPAFARSVYNIPLVGQIAKVFTFQDYKYANDTYNVEVKTPAISDLPDKTYETKVNDEIQARMDTVITEAKVRADETKKAFIATGGKEEDFIPIKISADYEIKHNSGEVLSFVINKTETSASAYNERFYYNLDIAAGHAITLAELLGDNYVENINNQVRLQMALKEQTSPYYYFHGDMGFKTISPDQKFYINSTGNVVIVFAKYEIAPGAMGPQEFEIKSGYQTESG